MNTAFVPGGRVPSYVLPLIATLIVAGSVFYSGVYAHMSAKDIDARFFYAAAKCWAAGMSPYQPETYDAMFRSIFGTAPEALFVAYLPTLMVIVLPMAPFDWGHAALLFSLMNFGAAMVLYWSCYRLVRHSLGRPLRPAEWLWVTLGSTLGAIAGSLITGQTSVFIAAACAIALVGCQLQRSWLTVVGLVVASAKPHLSGPILLFIVLFEPRQRTAVAVAVGLIAVIFAYAAVVDGHLLQSYLESIRVYNSLAVNDPSKLFGLVALLLRCGVAPQAAAIVGMLALAALLAFLGWSVWRLAKPLGELPVAILLLVLSTGLGRSIQGYDLCAYAVAIALLACISGRLQIALLLPALVIWRPSLVLGRGHPPEISNLVGTLAWLTLLFVVTAFLASGLSAQRRAFLRIRAPDSR